MTAAPPPPAAEPAAGSPTAAEADGVAPPVMLLARRADAALAVGRLCAAPPPPGVGVGRGVGFGVPRKLPGRSILPGGGLGVADCAVYAARKPESPVKPPLSFWSDLAILDAAAESCGVPALPPLDAGLASGRLGVALPPGTLPRPPGVRARSRSPASFASF